MSFWKSTMGGDHNRMDMISFHRRWDSEVVILQGESRAALIERGRQIQRATRGYLADVSGVALRDLAFSLRSELAEAPCRLAIVTSSFEDLDSKLARALERLDDPECTQIKDRSGIYFFENPLAGQGKLAFIFPGEGSQYVNMLSDLCLHFPEVRACFDLTDQAFTNSGRSEHIPSRFIFPQCDGNAGDGGLWRMESAVAAVTTANRALLTLLSGLEIRPQALLGHSTGEFTALQAAGIMDLRDESLYEQCVADLDGIYYHVAHEEGVPRAVMVAVGAEAIAVSQLIGDDDADVHIAMDNCPHQAVMVGHKDAVERVITEMRRQGMIYEVLPFDRPYHTPQFESYAENLRPFFDRWLTSPPNIPLYSCTTAALYPANLAQIRELAFEHWIRPVEFRKTIEAMHADGVRIFVEVGPRGNLTAFVDDILRIKPHLAVASNVLSRSGITQLNHLVGLLAAHGVDMQLDHLYVYRAPRKLSLRGMEDGDGQEARRKHSMKLALGLPMLQVEKRQASVHPRDRQVAKAREGQRANEKLDRGIDEMDPLPTSGQRTGPVRQSSIGPSPSSGPRGAVSSRDVVMQAYLRTMEHFLGTQQEVTQAFLVNGGAVTPSTLAVAQVQDPTQSSMGVLRDAERGRVQQEPVEAPSATISQTAAADPAQGLQEKTDHGVYSDFAPPAPTETEHLYDEGTDAPPSLEVDRAAPDNVGEILLRLVSDKTGYPLEMLDLTLDLEADLGIDSIKRVEILGTLQQETGVFEGGDLEQVAGLRTLQEMISFLTVEPEAVSHTVTSLQNLADIASQMPFIETIVSTVPGQELVVRREISLEEDLFLRDHTLGREISVTDTALIGLPVVPLTLSMEMMAEAAALLVPNRLLIGMKDIRAHRWIALEEPSIALQIIAKRSTSLDVVEVQVREADDPVGLRSPIVEGKVVFGDAYPHPPPVDEFHVCAEQPCECVTPGRFYPEAMFHGPSFQGIVSIDRWGENGAQATVSGLPAADLFRSVPDPSFLIDPVLLDALGQVVGFWIANFPTTDFVAFPFGLEALHIYEPRLEPGERAICQARMAVVGDQRTRADIDLIGQDGRLRMRLVGWGDTGFDMPKEFFRFILAPGEVEISSPWLTSFAGSPLSSGFQCRRLDGFPRDFFEAHGMIWKRALAHLVLSRRERETWRSLSGPPRRRTEWLLGRVVAKDAARLFLKDHYGMVLHPADIEIVADEHGRPVVEGPWIEQSDRMPNLSLTHSDGVAAAIASHSGDGIGVGIDIERIGRVSREAIEGLAFTPEEQELLASMDEVVKDEWALRLWCAKEAVAKALGLGMIEGPQALVAQSLDISTGRVEITPMGKMVRLAPVSAGSHMTAHTVHEGDWIAAICLHA